MSRARKDDDLFPPARGATDAEEDVAADDVLAALRRGMETAPHATRRFVLGTLLAAGPIVLTAKPGWAQAISVPDCEIVICLDNERCDDDDDDHGDDDDDDDEDRHRHQGGRGHDDHGRGYGYGHHDDDDDEDCEDDDDDRHQHRRGRGHYHHGQGHGYGHHDDDDDDDECDDVVVVNARNYIDFAADGHFNEPIYPTSQTGPYVDPQEARRIRRAIRRLARGKARIIGSGSCWTSAMDFLTNRHH